MALGCDGDLYAAEEPQTCPVLPVASSRTANSPGPQGKELKTMASSCNVIENGTALS